MTLQADLNYFNQEKLWRPPVHEQITVAEDLISMIPGDVLTILDAGCGNGAVTNRMVGRWDVLGCDISEAALSHVKAPTIVADLTAIPFEDNRFDLVLSSDVIEHLPNSIYLRCLHEIARVAKRYILIAVPYEELLEAAQVTCPKCHHKYHAHLHQRSYSTKDVLNLFAKDFGIRAMKLSGERWLYSDKFLVRKRKLLSGLDYPFENAICPVCGTMRGAIEISPESHTIGRRIDAIQAMLAMYGYLKIPSQSEILVLFERDYVSERPTLPADTAPTTNSLIEVSKLKCVTDPINYPPHPIRINSSHGELIIAMTMIPQKIQVITGGFNSVEKYDFVRQRYVPAFPEKNSAHIQQIPFGPQGLLLRFQNPSDDLTFEPTYDPTPERKEIIAMCLGHDHNDVAPPYFLVDFFESMKEIEEKRDKLERELYARDLALAALKKKHALALALINNVLTQQNSLKNELESFSPKSILVLSHMYPRHSHPSSGIFVHEQVKALRESGIDARVLSGEPYWINTFNPWRILKALLRWSKMECFEWEHHEGVPIIRFPYIVSRYFLPFQAHAHTYTHGVFNCLSRLKEAFNFQLVHAHTSFTDGSAGVKAAMKYDVPLVITEHTGPFTTLTRTPYLKKTTQSSINSASWFITVSSSLMNQVKSQLSINNNNICSVIPNIVDTDFFKPSAKAPSDCINILWIGHLVPIKRVDILISAFSHALKTNPNLLLKLVGSGELESEIRQLVNTLGIENHIVFVGPADRQQLQTHIHECDFLVISSEAETFGVVAIEAMSCGRPVLTTNCGGTEEIINQPFLGKIVNKSADNLAQGIIEMAAICRSFNPKLIRETAKQRYSKEKIVSSLKSIYSDVLRNWKSKVI